MSGRDLHEMLGRWLKEHTSEPDWPVLAGRAILSGMELVPLGRTGLRVSRLGFGTGSRFGDPAREVPATALVRKALHLGINYFDVAPMYGEAEQRLGTALAGVPRERFVVATKFFPVDEEKKVISPCRLRESVDTSLRRLGCGTIDVLQVHGLRPAWVEPVFAELGEELEALRRAGKFRHLGVTETIIEDPRHEMVGKALGAARLGTVLLAYGPLSPWAELNALPACGEAGGGAIAMVAVGKALRSVAAIREFLAAARARGELPAGPGATEDFLAWVGDAPSTTPAAVGLRFAAAHPAIGCVLSGTLDPAHLRANAAALAAPPMASAAVERIRDCFLRTDPARWRPADV